MNYVDLFYFLTSWIEIKTMCETDSKQLDNTRVCVKLVAFLSQFHLHQVNQT